MGAVQTCASTQP